MGAVAGAAAAVGVDGVTGRATGAPPPGAAGDAGGKGTCRVYFFCAQPDKNRTVTSSARAFLMPGLDYAMSYRALPINIKIGPGCADMQVVWRIGDRK